MLWDKRQAKLDRGLSYRDKYPPRQQIQVLPKVSQIQGQGNKVKNIGINRKVLSQGIDMCNIKALSLLVQKLWPRVSFFKSRSKLEVKVIG